MKKRALCRVSSNPNHGGIITQVMSKSQLEIILETKGWVKSSLGIHRTTKNGMDITEPIQGFQAYTRKRKFLDFLDSQGSKNGEFLKNSPSEASPNAHKQRENSVGSSSPLGDPYPNLTPSKNDGHLLPVLADFESYPALKAARPNSPCLLIGYDSEWENLPGGDRDMLSWQFAYIDGDNLVEIVILKDGKKKLSLDNALGFVLDSIGCSSVDVRKIRRWEYCYGWDEKDPTKPLLKVTDVVDEARRHCVYVYRGRDKGYTHELVQSMPDRYLKRSERDWAWFHAFLDFSGVDSIPVTLVCHAGLVDLSALSHSDYLLRHLSSVQGGLISLQPVRLAPRSLKTSRHARVYPVSLSVADTMCHAPAGSKSLKALGEAVGVHKLDIPSEQKAHMLDLLNRDPALFLDYASTDSVVTLLYCSALYGYNNRPPVTVTSAAAKVMRETMEVYMCTKTDDDFNSKYRGLCKVSHGNYKLKDRPGYIEAKSLEPISDKANSVQYYCSQAYHGGYNCCSEVGYFPQETFDYDLQNAYPTAMCVVPDIDWQNPVKVQIQNQDMNLGLFNTGLGGFNPIIPFVGYCRFEFPKDVKYPCIPVNCDGIPVYPRTSGNLDGVYVAGPFIYLALRLGARVFCENGYFLNTLITPDLHESRSLSHAVVQLVRDRARAKKEHGKKSLEELILKTMVNSGYGKTAQNVVQKQSWTAFKDLMEDLGCSAITNPVSAMMTTSIVQCELLAAQNQVSRLGYTFCSVTTDGGISDCPEEVIKSLDLYGFRPIMEQARLYLTDGASPEIWEIKHHQDDLINFTTRGNVSLYPHGVCAHNSAKSGFESDSYDDRLWLMTQVLSRTGTVDCSYTEWTSFKDVVQGKDFGVKTVTRHLHMDYDLKRKPDRSSFGTDTPVVEGVTYEIAHFDTVPYEDISEFRNYRKKKKLVDCLRTESDWKNFFVKVDMNACGMQVKDMDWAIIMSCVMGYRAGFWDIPGLTKQPTVKDKCAWINKHNDSKRQFKLNDWKNSRRPERQVNMLPRSYLSDKLEELQSDTE